MKSVGKEIMEDSKRTSKTLTFDEELHFLEQETQPEKKSNLKSISEPEPLDPLDVVTFNVSKKLSLPSIRTSPSPKANAIQDEIISSMNSRRGNDKDFLTVTDTSVISRMPSTDQNQFPCFICKVKLLSAANLKLHLETMHTTKNRKIKQPPQQSNHTNQEQLNQVRLFQCPHCPRKVKLIGNFKTHLLSHTEDSSFICENCGSKFLGVISLRDHQLPDKGLDREYNCKHCNESFKAIKCYWSHSQLFHGNKIEKTYSESEGEIFCCCKCDKVFHSRAGRNFHEKTVHKVKYCCQICKKYFDTRSQRLIHLRKHLSQSKEKPKLSVKNPDGLDFLTIFNNIKKPPPTPTLLKLPQQPKKTVVTRTISISCPPDQSKTDRRKQVLTSVSSTPALPLQTDAGMLNNNDHQQGQTAVPKFKCQHCNSSFDDQTYFFRHLKLEHGKSIETISQAELDIYRLQKYECSKCDKVFISRSGRDLHEDSVHKIKCQICYQVFNTRYQRNIHLRLQHVKTTQIIPVSQPNKSFGLGHMILPPNGQVFLKITDPISPRTRSIQKRPSVPTSTEMVQDKDKGSSSRSPGNHNTSLKTKCININDPDAGIPIETATISMSPSAPLVQYACPFCIKIQRSPSSLQSHLETHHSNRMPKSPVDSRLSDTDHHNNMSEDGTKTQFPIAPSIFQCPFCPKQFRLASIYDSHVLTHNKGEPYVCEMCGSKYKRRSTYRRHQDKCRRVVNRKFKCRHCDLSFGKQAYFYMHLNVLHGKRIERKSQTEVDINNEQNYECSECDKVFLTRSGRDLHEYTIHQIKCQICHEVFNTRTEHKNHRFQHLLDANRTFGCNSDGTMNFSIFKTPNEDPGRPSILTSRQQQTNVITTQIIPVLHPEKSRANRRKQDLKSVSSPSAPFRVMGYETTGVSSISVPIPCENTVRPLAPPTLDPDPLDLKQEPVEPLLQTNEDSVSSWVRSITMDPLASVPFVCEWSYPDVIPTTVLKMEP